MALIKCSSCNKNISDKAVKCPHCGTQFKRQEHQNKIAIVKIFMLIGLILYTLYAFINVISVIKGLVFYCQHINILSYGNIMIGIFILFNRIIKPLFFIACSIFPWLVLFLRNKHIKFLKIYSLVLMMINIVLNINYLLINQVAGAQSLAIAEPDMYTYSIIYNLINTATIPFLIYFALIGNKDNDLAVKKKDILINKELKEKVIQEKNISNINNIYVWLVAFTPILAILIFWIFSYILRSYWIGVIISIIFVNIQILFVVNDYKMLNNSGIDTTSFGKFSAIRVVVPKYLLKRVDILKQNVSYFIVWLVGVIIFIISVLIIGFNPLYLFNSNYNDNKQLENEQLQVKDAIACFEKNKICIENDELKQMVSDTRNTDVEALIYLLDEKLLKEIYSNERENFEKKVKEEIEDLKERYGGEEEFVEDLKKYTSLKSIEEYKDYVLLSYYQNKAIQDYEKKQINEKEIKNYYDNEITEKIRVSHILIKPEITADMNQDTKDIIEYHALERAKYVIKQLDNGADFIKLAKEYSDDEATKDKGGDLGYISKDDTVESFYNSANALKINSYSKEPIKTEYGYHIILKTKENEKPKLEEVRDEIIEKLVQELMSNDATLSIKALENIRNEYKLNIYDDDLKAKYDEHIKDLLEQVENR